MAKAILMSIKPKYVAKILNGKKTIEIRKKFPKDYVGWVYIYCTKEQGLARLYNGRWNDTFVCEKDITDNEFKRMYSGYDGKGKVVARFWCDRVENLYEYQIDGYGSDYEIASDTLKQEELLKECCLTYDQLSDYLGDINNGKAIHITKLGIFDKPKEIKEFYQYCDKHFSWWKNKCLDCKAYTPDTDIEDYCNKNKLALTRAPQSYCFIEV